MSTDTARKQNERIADRMRLARRLAGLSQEDAARALDVTVRTYARWEKNETTGFLEELPRIAQAFGTTVDELVSSHNEERIEALEAEVEELRRIVAALVGTRN